MLAHVDDKMTVISHYRSCAFFESSQFKPDRTFALFNLDVSFDWKFCLFHQFQLSLIIYSQLSRAPLALESLTVGCKAVIDLPFDVLQLFLHLLDHFLRIDRDAGDVRRSALCCNRLFINSCSMALKKVLSTASLLRRMQNLLVRLQDSVRECNPRCDSFLLLRYIGR